MKQPPLSSPDTLETENSELNPLDERIRSLEQIFNLVLAGLHRDRALLSTRIDRRRAMYAPVRMLPRDILIRIFDAALIESHLSHAWPPTPNLNFRQPRRLSRV
ncbi:hypothetical protein BDZ89DRAFT_1161319 [Hymenopellis radicata]|nr:hypothetical protein BDZ89DRAFT_1161319 [Hymenopellis radicata]